MLRTGSRQHAHAIPQWMLMTTPLSMVIQCQASLSDCYMKPITDSTCTNCTHERKTNGQEHTLSNISLACERHFDTNLLTKHIYSRTTPTVGRAPNIKWLCATRFPTSHPQRVYTDSKNGGLGRVKRVQRPATIIYSAGGATSGGIWLISTSYSALYASQRSTTPNPPPPLPLLLTMTHFLTF